MLDNGRAVDYSKYETMLNELIVTLKGDLLDIEMALQQALELARGSFFNSIKSINEDMNSNQQECFTNISEEFAQFSVKLKEELNKERDNF